MTQADHVLLTITFPGLSQAQASERVAALRAFAERKVGTLEFVNDQDEGHLSVGLTFAVMVTVPTAALIWQAYFSEFGQRNPAKVRFDIDGSKAFEGQVADPDAFPVSKP